MNDVEDAGRNIVAPEGEQASTSSSRASESSSSSSSEVEEGYASPLPNKRQRRIPRSDRQVSTRSDPRVDTLMTQMSYISNYLAHLPAYLNMSANTQNSEVRPSTSSQPEQFLVKPTRIDQQSLSLALGTLGTSFDEKKIIPPSNVERLAELNKLQQFDSPAWKAIRYKKSLQESLASPGFTGLKVNDELCHFNKRKDYLASTEQLLAGLSNRVLEQRHLLRTGLQSVLDWATTNPKDLDPSSLFDKISETFGPGSLSHKNSETTMQIICGKRSECIETRRDRILKEIKNQNLRSTLQNVPPSSEHLFSRDSLQPVIQSLGGSQVWLNIPSYLKEKKIIADDTEVLDRFDHANNNSFSNKKYSYKGRAKRQDKKVRQVPRGDQPFRNRSSYKRGPKSNSVNKQA